MKPVTVPNAAGRTLGRRIANTFLAPAQLAGELRATAPWLDVLLLSTAVAVLGVLAMPDEIFTEAMREAVTRRGQPVEITSPAEEVARWGRAMGMLATFATHPVIPFVLAGVLSLVFSILGGGRTTYREFLSLSAHAMLIPALGGLIALGIRLATGVAGAGTIGAFLGPDDASNLAVATATSIDPFLFWMMVVIGIGTHALDPRWSRRQAVTILVAGYVLFVFLTTYVLHPELRI